MNHAESTKTVAKLGTADTTTAQTFTHSIDTLGYDYASIDVVFEANAATTNAVATALKLGQGDTTAAYTDITAYVGGGSGGFTIPTTSLTDASNVVRFNVDMRGKKRYLNVSATPIAASVVCAVAQLSKAEVGPANASEAGVAAVVSG